MNITKTIAEQVATKMIQPIKDCIEKKTTEVSLPVESIMESINKYRKE